MGLGGAKFEHSNRLDVGRTGVFSCGPLTTEATVRHSVLLPAKTGFVYQTGIAFANIGESEHELLIDLLVHEAHEQVVEWESNLQGVERDAAPVRRAARKSAVAVRFLRLRRTSFGWDQKVTSDPNQPIDGLTIVLDGTTEDELAVLKRTYDAADETMREFMRRVATVSILEQLRS